MAGGRASSTHFRRGLFLWRILTNIRIVTKRVLLNIAGKYAYASLLPHLVRAVGKGSD